LQGQKKVGTRRIDPRLDAVIIDSYYRDALGYCFLIEVNNHRLKPVALPCSGVARPPAAVVSIHQLKLVVLKSELINLI
jgi:hypothetical protein